jgi:hypothetical protein
MGLVDADYKFIWADLSGKGLSSDAQIYNNSEIKEFAENRTLMLYPMTTRMSPYSQYSKTKHENN